MAGKRRGRKEVFWEGGEWKHVIPVGAEASQADPLCLTALPAGSLCGPDELCTEYRERETQRQKQTRAKWHILISTNKETTSNKKPSMKENWDSTVK